VTDGTNDRMDDAASPRIEPQTPATLAVLIASLAVAAREPGPGAPARSAVRLGIDGPSEPDAGALADTVAEALQDLGVPVARVRALDFFRARSLRLEYGSGDPEAFYDGWYDVAALRREVLDPLGPGGSMAWLPRLRDPVTDRSVREGPRTAAPGTVAVLDGRFLGREPLRGGLDVLVHLDVTPAARARRVPPAEAPGVLPAWQRYLDECAPAAGADLVVRYDHPDRPAVVVRVTGPR